MTSSSRVHSNPQLAGISDVDIESGYFEFTVLRVYDDITAESKYILRGFSNPDDVVVVKARNEVLMHGLKSEVVGGGFLQHFPDRKLVLLYSYDSGQQNEAMMALAINLIETRFVDGYQALFMNVRNMPPPQGIVAGPIEQTPAEGLRGEAVRGTGRPLGGALPAPPYVGPPPYSPPHVTPFSQPFLPPIGGIPHLAPMSGAYFRPTGAPYVGTPTRGPMDPQHPK